MWTRRVLAIGLLVSSMPAAVRAQDACVTVPQNNRTWKPPLDRPITLHMRTGSLRDALTKAAGEARIRLSYAAEALPLDRALCASFDAAPVGQVLAVLLERAPVDVVVVGGNHVVLAPIAKQAAQQPGEQALEAVVRLGPVVVNGASDLPQLQRQPTSTTILDGRELERTGSSDIASALNGAVPGVWVWQPSSASLGVQYASLRGASSFGLSYPKVYIDGIEVANPLLLTRFSPDAIERVELIRGPGGASLYGGDAIAGVTNIVTRNTYEPGGAHKVLRSDFGVAVSQFANGASMAHEQSLSLRGGSPALSGGLNLRLGNEGDVVASGNARHAAADGSVRLVRERSVITGTLHWFTQSAANLFSPLLTDSIAHYNAADAGAQSMHQFTAGIQGRFQPNARWTHSLVAGMDTYSLHQAGDEWMPLLSPADSALRAAAHGTRATFRAISARHFKVATLGSGALTFAADHSELRQRGVSDELAHFQTQPQMVLHNPGRRLTQHSYNPDPPTEGTGQVSMLVVPRLILQNSSGISTHLDATLLNRFMLAGGLRIERQSAFGIMPAYATLPSISAAWLGSHGIATLRVRSSYSQGVRWPQYATTTLSAREVNALGPERQSGVELGADLTVGRALTLQLTRFDQTATDLIQRTVVPGYGMENQPHPRIGFELQNVGEITNRGWEALARVQRGPLALTGTLSLVDSRVQQVADGYTGDLRAGDRMLAIPARTASLSASWTNDGWFLSATAARANDWVNYDRIALARAITSVTTPTLSLTGSELRTFWQDYDGMTHLRASLSRDLQHGLALHLVGENLLNRQLGEPDNITITPGRTLSIGIRAAF